MLGCIQREVLLGVTSLCRQCDALTLATQDASTIEAVMSTSITTTIKIARKVPSIDKSHVATTDPVAE